MVSGLSSTYCDVCVVTSPHMRNSVTHDSTEFNAAPHTPTHHVVAAIPVRAVAVATLASLAPAPPRAR